MGSCCSAGAGTQPQDPQPLSARGCTPHSRQGTGDTGTPTGQSEPCQAPHGPRAEPGAASIPPGQGWAAPPATPQEALQGRAPPSPICHPAAFLEAMAAGTPGQQARGGDRETRGNRKPFPSCGARGGTGPRRSSVGTHLTLIRYWARLMLAADPVMVTCLSVEPSTGLAILI